MNRTTSALALCAALTLPLAALAGPIQTHADGSVTADGLTYSSKTEYYRSTEFQESGRRCATPEPQVISEFAPSDCSFSMTSVEADYEPANGDAFVIPVVFHIIERSDGSTGVVSDALVASQIDILNEDFEALAGSPGAPGTVAKITFQLAQFDEDGNPTTGIERVVNNSFFDNPESAKTALRWDPNRFFNIYTNSASGALGYATFPTQSAGDADDGIVLLWDAVGRNSPGGAPYNQGRTATHEVGHYLGLRHIWGDESSCNNGYTSGDFIQDTVPSTGPEFQCNTGANTCGAGNNVANYMDYSDDTCMDNFTAEQVNRMRCSIVHYRSALFNALPTVDFDFEPAELVYTFTDLSSDSDGSVTAWAWDFGDGATSTEQNPSHTYADYGIYDVTLRATDNRGVSASKTVSITVNVAPVASFDYSGDLSVLFTDTSSDANGTIASWEWDFGDGQTSIAQSPTNVYVAEGLYTVSLTVTDDLGTKTTITADIDVTEGGCGCSSSGSGGPFGTILVFGLAFLAIRRRRA